MGWLQAVHPPLAWLEAVHPPLGCWCAPRVTTCALIYDSSRLMTLTLCMVSATQLMRTFHRRRRCQLRGRAGHWLRRALARALNGSG